MDSSTPFVIHTIPGSPYARAVAATLEEKGARWHVAALTPGAHKSMPHLSRHPFGKMPVLEHDGFVLYETQAILRYIDRILPAPSLTPADPRLAARMDQVLNVNDCYVFPGCANVIAWNRVVGPKLLGLVPDEAAITSAMPHALNVFSELARLLGENRFFAGEHVSLADLALAPQLDFLAEAPEWTMLTGNAPALQGWLERMRSRPSMRATTWEEVAARAA